jgi:hypothetical protein
MWWERFESATVSKAAVCSTAQPTNCAGTTGGFHGGASGFLVQPTKTL